MHQSWKRLWFWEHIKFHHCAFFNPQWKFYKNNISVFLVENVTMLFFFNFAFHAKTKKQIFNLIYLPTLVHWFCGASFWWFSFLSSLCFLEPTYRKWREKSFVLFFISVLLKSWNTTVKVEALQIQTSMKSQCQCAKQKNHPWEKDEPTYKKSSGNTQTQKVFWK